MANETNQYTHQLKKLFADNFTFTKRQLGLLLSIGGGVAFLGILALDIIGGGREGGIGPAQRSALIVMAGVTLLGLSLIPLGDDPA